MFNLIPEQMFTHVFQLACCALAIMTCLATFFLAPRS